MENSGTSKFSPQFGGWGVEGLQGLCGITENEVGGFIMTAVQSSPTKVTDLCHRLSAYIKCTSAIEELDQLSQPVSIHNMYMSYRRVRSTVTDCQRT